jgi:hypothetical protein
MASSSTPLFAVDTSLSLGMRVEGSMLEQQHESTMSSGGRHGVPPTLAPYKVQKMPYRCKFCLRTFKCPRGLGGHQKAHRDLRDALYWRSSSYAANLHRASLEEEQFTAWRIHYYHPFGRSVPPSFPWQTGTGSPAPMQLPSSEPAVHRYGGTGDEGRHLGRLHEVNQKETDDGIDLSLKL